MGIRGKWALAAAAAVLLVAGCGRDKNSEIPEGWNTKAEVQQQLAEERQKVSIPLGWRWQDKVEGADRDIYESGAAQAIVLDEATCAWSITWLKSAEKNDVRGQKRAATELETLRELPAYQNNDSSYRDLVEDAQSKSELGDTSALRRYVDNNCETYK
ncbi:hypothetical protein [Streptomyces sp. NPDC058847]|uniref:hypothetical protein n=1 Tax=Streptomyces sp. NPDC058847 TaxID=3346649 RepID=UPI00367E249C